MKCVCGYEFKVDKQWNIIKGDDDFKKFEVYNIDTKYFEPQEANLITLYVCPKCNTVQIYDFW